MKTKACKTQGWSLLGILETGKGCVGEGRAEDVGAEKHRVVTAMKTHSCSSVLPDLLILPQPAGSRGLPRNR